MTVSQVKKLQGRVQKFRKGGVNMERCGKGSVEDAVGPRMQGTEALAI